MRDKENIIEDKELDISNLLNARKRLKEMINDVSDCEYADDLRAYLNEDMKELEMIIGRLKADIEDMQNEETPEDDYNERMREYREMQGF